MTLPSARLGTSVAPHIGRVTACIIGACVIGHVPVIAGHARAHPVTIGLMVAISLACLTCFLHLWRGPTIRTWKLVRILAIAMLVAHLPMLLSSVDLSEPLRATAASHDQAHESTGAEGLSWMHTLSGLSVLQVLIAGTVIFRYNRQHAAELRSAPLQSQNDASG